MFVWMVGLPDALYASTTITCESHDNMSNKCRVDTRGGVTLVTQLSHAGCYEGNTWGYDDRFIWVTNGCRAVFRTGNNEHRSEHHINDSAGAALAGIALAALGAAVIHESHKDHHQERSSDYYEYQPNERDLDYYDRRHARYRKVTCESQDKKYRYCEESVRDGHVRLVRQHSKSSCRFGDDWGYDWRGIWVENGCRATFEIEY